MNTKPETHDEAAQPKARRPKSLHKFEIEARVSLVRDAKVAERADVVDSPRAAAAILTPFIGSKTKEHFVIIALNARRQALGVVTVSIGTLSASLVHPREVFQAAILLNAASIVVSHNHPSGDANPSAEDRDVTRRLQRAGELLGIPMADHIIVAGDEFFSFRERGLL